MSIALPWSEFKVYVAEVGPGRARVPRPAGCERCDGDRVWFNGWRRVLVTLLVDGQPHRPGEWLPLQRVRCARRACGRSWTLRPPWLYPHRSLQPDLAEAAALAYLTDPGATYPAVARTVGCAWVTVWRWVGWVAALGTPAALLARVARLAPARRCPGCCRPPCRRRRGPARPRARAPCAAPPRSSPRSPSGTGPSPSRPRTQAPSACSSSTRSSGAGGSPT